MLIVVGASGGLGSHLVKKMAGDHQIIGTYNNTQPPPDSGARMMHRVDVTDSDSVRRFVREVGGTVERIVLVYMAGISLDGMGHKMKEDIWDRVVQTNLKGCFLMSQAFLPLMREQGWGRIINISSIVGQTGIPGTCAYSASKSGIFGLTRTLAAENVTKGITVNALALGYYDAGMIGVIPPEIQEVIKKKIPMKRFGDPDNLVHAVEFLIKSDYTTGSIINMNGGLF